MIHILPHMSVLKWSIAALLAGNAVDTHSSWGRQELNPILGQHEFNLKSTGIKFGIIGGVLGLEYLVIKKHPQMKKQIEYWNFTAAGVTTTVAIRNYRLE